MAHLSEEIISSYPCRSNMYKYASFSIHPKSFFSTEKTGPVPEAFITVPPPNQPFDYSFLQDFFGRFSDPGPHTLKGFS